jgi:hypothetical protein
LTQASTAEKLKGYGRSLEDQMPKKVVLAVALVFTVSSGLFADQGNSQGRGRSGGNSGGNSSNSGTDVNIAVNLFTDHDRITFRDYFSTHKIVAQPLPPGIAKNVARGKPLPPGIAKKAVPADLVRTLGSRAGSGITFSIVGDRVVAVRAGNVIDLLVDVFR